MDSYVSNPDNIPATDLYVEVPFYGRYFPQTGRFSCQSPARQLGGRRLPAILGLSCHLCNESLRIYPADEGGRDVFALGSIIVKSSHLHKLKDGQQHAEIDYSSADANEVQAVALARRVLKDVRVPEIYFAGKVIMLSDYLALSFINHNLQINGRQVLVQERLPGVGLNVAWPYLSQDQKESFKQQARDILRQLHTIKPADGRQARSHAVPDPNILTNGRIGALEDILFSDSTNADPDMGFMHNDLAKSNWIVDKNKIVGLVDWEMVGFFGWKTAGEVHRRIRTPQREHFANANVSEETLRDIMWWNDLYDDGRPEVGE